jgi:hypothetical protein
MYGERLSQLDLRIAKVIRTGRVRTTAGVDLYNIFNANPVLTLSPAFATWQRPQSILGPRFAELVMKVDF